MASLIPPHGGTLINRLATEGEAGALSEEAKGLPALALGMRPLSDLEMIAVGAFSPLAGFMDRATYTGVVRDMHLPSGLAWSLPVTLSATADLARKVEGKKVALTDESGSPIAVMDVAEAFPYDKEE